MCDSSDFLDIKEYSRELGEVIYPNVRKNPKKERQVLFFTTEKGSEKLLLNSEKFYFQMILRRMR